ncbi:MAG: bifunctional shikimate kinase/3-dehydroquinate synthase [Deltaproteobacteria bacterium]|nr:bifunctional shikimate kinase/3-dehydroquinate synthase [Deltaproteobacteria bacterium]
MCVGKSTLAGPLGSALALPAHDLDARIEESAGRSIPAIFSEEGEAAFRSLEREALRELLAGPPAVIACGGGALLEAGAWALAREAGAVVVSLEAPPEVLALRASAEGRPLLEGADTPAARAERLSRLQAERGPVYARADLRLDTSDGSPDELAALLLQEVLAHLGRSVPFRVPGAGHQLIITEGGLAAAADWIQQTLPPGEGREQLGLVADEVVLGLHGAPLREALEARGYRVAVIPVPAGEDCKRWAVLEGVLDGLLSAGLQRGSTVLGLGGGSATDLAGLAAALLKRGCHLIQLPTTLLGMIDAALGGKTAVNHRLGKNLVGAFHQPDLVVASLKTLETLPGEERRSAFGEVAKYALLQGDAGLAWAEGLRMPRDLSEVVLRCAGQKARCVEADPREGGARIHLNLGHTLGHALEPGDPGDAERPPLRHGEAVGLGLLAALRLAAALELGPPEREDRVKALLAGWGLPVDLDRRLSPLVWERLEADKKRRGEALDFVLPTPEGVEVISLTSDGARGILDPTRRWQ